MMKEEFSPEQIEILEQFVSSTSNNIFALVNLPEVIKGALFSRYSRSSLGLRSLLLKEFILNESAGLKNHPTASNLLSIQKAQNFYDRILDGYGDDSIGELGGAHLAAEGVSMLGAKALEDARLGGSPLEKSTRYISFDQKSDGEYLFYREPVLMTSAYRELFLSTCNHLFDTYAKLIPVLTEKMASGFPHDPLISKNAYTAALRAKVLDCLRGLLPAATLTNVGIFGNGRFFESLLQKLECHTLAEMQEIGKKAYQELSKVIPSFVRRAEPAHKHHLSFARFTETMQSDLLQMIGRHSPSIPKRSEEGVHLISWDKEGPIKVASALLFSNTQHDLASIQAYCANLPEEELGHILDAACSARENRRHKSPRALEHAFFTFEIVSDFGVYRDLHRHRMLTQERQLLSCDHGAYVPPEIVGTDMESIYMEALEIGKKAYDTIAGELPEEAQYVVPMAYNIRWYFHVNLRALQWLCELRSQAAGHTSYRRIAQAMAHQVSVVCPLFERFFKYVDYQGYDLGRLEAEIRQEQKVLHRNV